ncbi:helix-turn-helix transcriptional regulator [Sphingomonas adhaesiva]|uniref:helix-turn-helix transcriptional regulator n=1 Tax=Sphingomonas adhaesiva TaxID=28212 RepID=UPI002FFC387C
MIATAATTDRQPKTTRTAVTTDTTESQPDDDLISLEEVKRLAGIGKTMIYRLERARRFPQRYKPGGHASRWSRREVMEWRADQRQARTS